MFDTTENCDDFVSANDNAKSEIVSRLVSMARKERLDYGEFLYVCQQARRKLGLRRPKRHRKLPQLLSESDLKRFFRAIQECGDVEHEIMLRFLFFGLREVPWKFPNRATNFRKHLHFPSADEVY